MNELLVRLEWFKAVVLPHEAAVRSRLRRICPPGFDIDNLVAESLSRAYQVRDFPRITAGRVFLQTIARNLLIDTLRRETVVSLDFVADLDALRGDDAMTERQIEARDELRALQVIVDTLPSQARKVFILRRVYDLSLGAIAEEMGLSVSTVEKHLSKALRLVVEALAQREGGDGFARAASQRQPAAGDRRASGPLGR